MNIFILIPIIFVFIIIAGIVIFFWWYEKKRTEEIIAVASRLGWTFKKNPSETEIKTGQKQSFWNLPGSAGFFFFGSPSVYSNLIKGSYKGRAWSIYDYKCIHDFGEDKKELKMTIVQAATKKTVPDFQLSPENIRHFFENLAGYGDIDFASHPVFSKKFVLRGKDEPEIRKFFKPELLTYMEKIKPNLCIVAGGNTLNAYLQNERIESSIEDIKDFLDQVEMLLQKMDA
jgi:hypothetical protein